jgi:hypothetical protein
LSEQGLIGRLKELAGRVVGGRVPAPSVSAVSPTAVVEQGAPTDELTVLASKLGLDPADVEVCRETRENYKWCLVLLDPGRISPPPAPFPERLHGLLLKLIGKGKIEAGKLRILGLDKRLAEVVARRVEEAVSALVKSPRPERRELVEEFTKIREVFKNTSRAVQPEILEEKVLHRLRGVLPSQLREVEHSVVEMLRGKISVAKAVEDIVVTIKKAEVARGEREVVEKGKRAEVKQEQPVIARSQAPRSE